MRSWTIANHQNHINMSGDAHLYGARKAKVPKKEISSSTSLAFTSQLSSLLSTSSTETRTAGRARPSASKPSIFTSHNKNAKKRAARDLEDEDLRKSTGRQDLGGVDDNVLHRSKRKMEEKARLYAAMKRGDYVASEGAQEGLIDFDRKWAERQEKEEHEEEDGSSGSEDEHDVDNETVEYEDEFGRMRFGTRADAERMERRKTNRLLGAEELNRMSARPAMPEGLIYGDTVQVAAFNPDEPIVAQMEEIARKRDRSMTPPDAVHYEADKEFRTKGVGFFNFSKDEPTRMKEMEALERERLETEKMRREREEKKEKRKIEIEERRKLVSEKRAKRQADSFLEGLTSELVGEDVT